MRKYFERWRRRRLANGPVSMRAELSWRGKVLRVLLMLLAFCGALSLGAGGGYWLAVQEGALGAVRQMQSLQQMQSQQLHDAEQIQLLEQQLKVENATRETLAKDLKSAQAEVLARQQALDFFDNLLTSNDRSRPLRMMACELQANGSGHYRYRLLLAQGHNNIADFSGRVVVALRYLRRSQAGRITAGEDRPLPVKFRHYQRVEGELDLPADAVPQQWEAKVIAEGDGQTVASCQKRVGVE